MSNKISQLDIGDGNIYDFVGGSDIPVYQTMAEALAAIQSGQIPNEQPFIVKEGSQGQPIFVGTTAAINAADQAGQIPDGMIIYCTDDDAGANITASSIEYGSSTVKDELDNIKVCKLLGSAYTPTTANGTVTIALSETYANYTFLAIRYGFGWGWSAWTVVPVQNNMGIINVVGAYDSTVRHGRIDFLSYTSIKVTAVTLLGTSATSSPIDKVEVYGVIKNKY